MENMKETIDRLIDIGQQLAEPKQVTICGKTYANKDLTRYDKPKYPRALTGNTLTGLLDYLEYVLPGERVDADDWHFCMIDSCKRVRVVSRLDEEGERETLFQADAVVNGFEFDRWYGQEEFVIALQANFLPTKDLDAVKAVSGNVQKSSVETYGDDGTTQKATISTGIASKTDVIVPNPVTLTPYRTFLEAGQPDSPFVFRIKAEDGKPPMFKLVAADGAVWELLAIDNIRKYLRKEFDRRGIPLPIIG